MLHPETDLQSGVFDSAVMRKNQVRSTDRTVTSYELELFHVDSGRSYVNGDGFTSRRGMLLCAKPGQIRHSEFPVRCSFIRLSAAGAAREGISALLESLPVCTYLSDEESVERLIGSFATLNHRLIASSSSELRELRVNAAFLELFYRVIGLVRGSGTGTEGGRLHPTVLKAYEYINEHYAEDCSLERLSDAVSMSKNYFHTLFTEQVGKTPYEYVTEKRIEQAKERIVAGERSMYEIALEVGFCSQSHFTKVFRGVTGMTPMEYRRRLSELF